MGMGKKESKIANITVYCSYYLLFMTDCAWKPINTSYNGRFEMPITNATIILAIFSWF